MRKEKLKQRSQEMLKKRLKKQKGIQTNQNTEIISKHTYITKKITEKKNLNHNNKHLKRLREQE